MYKRRLSALLGAVKATKDVAIETFPGWLKILVKFALSLSGQLRANGRPKLMFINQTPPEPKFAGRAEALKTITEWYWSEDVRIGAVIGWGGVGKSALVRRWYDLLEANSIQPDGVFWWGFYHNAYLEPFLNALLKYVSRGRIDPESVKSTYEKAERIKEHICQASYIIIKSHIVSRLSEQVLRYRKGVLFCFSA
jgi:hypothetical protein